jgi:acyl-CoA synthetase (AMP-forming)/AMP-acid ligase II/acyl carrier protein
MSTPNLLSILKQRAEESPNQLAYVFLQDGCSQEKSITYQQLFQDSCNIAAKLRPLISKGARVLLLYPQGLDFISAFLGSLTAEAIAVPANLPKRNQKISRLKSIIQDSQPEIILTTSSLLAKITDNLTDAVNYPNVQWLATDNLAHEQELAWDFSHISDDLILLLQYTSGSTGIPKGVMVSHGNIRHNSSCIQAALELTEQSVSVTWLPHFHDMGLIDGLIQPLYTGFLGVVIPPEAFLQNPILWLQTITKYRATHSGAPNMGYELCIQKITDADKQNLDLSSWLSAYNGAEPIRGQTLEKFTDKFKTVGFKSHYFYASYGMAEATLMISGGSIHSEPVYFNAQVEALANKIAVQAVQVEPVNIAQEGYKQIVGCGKAALETDIRIVDPETFTEVIDHQVGEIWVHSPSVGQGYWRQQEQTVATFQARLTETGDKNFLRTGDLGFIQDGELFITGRLKDLIIIWGKNHYPQDIEYSVQLSHKALRADSGAAFGIELDNQEKLVIVQEVERTYLAKLDVDEVMAAIREAVSSNHDLQVYAIALIKPASISKTSSGKIQRTVCRQRFLQDDLDIVGIWRQSIGNPQVSSETESLVTQENIEEWLLDKLVSSLGIAPEEIDFEEPWVNYGLDSSLAISLTGELEKWLNLDLETTLFWEYPKISELVIYLVQEVTEK